MMVLMQTKKSKTMETTHIANHKSLTTIYIHDISLVLDKEDVSK